MKIKLLTSAFDDLKNGRIFYEAQSENLGDYFFDSLFSDIDSLILYAGIYQKIKQRNNLSISSANKNMHIGSGKHLHD